MHSHNSSCYRNHCYEPVSYKLQDSDSTGVKSEIKSKINLIISLVAEDESNLVRTSVEHVEAARFDEYKPPKGMKVKKITIGRFV